MKNRLDKLNECLTQMKELLDDYTPPSYEDKIIKRMWTRYNLLTKRMHKKDAIQIINDEYHYSLNDIINIIDNLERRGF